MLVSMPWIFLLSSTQIVGAGSIPTSPLGLMVWLLPFRRRCFSSESTPFTFDFCQVGMIWSTPRISASIPYRVEDPGLGQNPSPWHIFWPLPAKKSWIISKTTPLIFDSSPVACISVWIRSNRLNPMGFWFNATQAVAPGLLVWFLPCRRRYIKVRLHPLDFWFDSCQVGGSQLGSTPTHGPLLQLHPGSRRWIISGLGFYQTNLRCMELPYWLQKWWLYLIKMLTGYHIYRQ